MLFTSLVETARNSPFKSPLTDAQCEASSPVEGRTIAAAATAVEGGLKNNLFFLNQKIKIILSRWLCLWFR